MIPFKQFILESIDVESIPMRFISTKIIQTLPTLTIEKTPVDDGKLSLNKFNAAFTLHGTWYPADKILSCSGLSFSIELLILPSSPYYTKKYGNWVSNFTTSVERKNHKSTIITELEKYSLKSDPVAGDLFGGMIDYL